MAGGGALGKEKGENDINVERLENGWGEMIKMHNI